MGLLDSLKNTLKDGKLTPASMALIQAGAKMMEAGGPSYQPRNFGSAVGSGLGGLLEGYVAGSEIERRNAKALDDQAYRTAQLSALQNPAPKAGTPGQGFIPPDAKYEKNTEYGIEGWRLKDGSFVPNQKAITEYQMRMTDPKNRGLVANAVGGQKPVKALDEENREYYTNPAELNPGAFPNVLNNTRPPAQMPRQGPTTTLPGGVNIENTGMPYTAEDWAAIQADIAARGGQGAPPTPGAGSPVKGMSFGEKESVKTDEAIRQKKAESDLLLNRKTQEPLPVPALKMVQEKEDEVKTTASIHADLDTLINQIDDGTLKLGPLDNLRNKSLLMMNASDEGARAYGELNNVIEKIRNDALRANKGPQTKADADNALNEIASHYTDIKYVRQRLKTLQNIYARDSENNVRLIQGVYKNYGKEVPNLDEFIIQKSAIGSKPKVTSQKEYDDLPSGTEFVDENGDPFRKP